MFQTDLELPKDATCRGRSMSGGRPPDRTRPGGVLQNEVTEGRGSVNFPAWGAAIRYKEKRQHGGLRLRARKTGETVLTDDVSAAST